VQVQAPICIELILAMGVGAILAWLFSIWTRLLRGIESGKQMRQMRSKEERIQELEQNIAQRQAELQEKQSMSLSATLQEQDAETTKAFAQSI
jgi:gas vesicle protein